MSSAELRQLQSKVEKALVVSEKRDLVDARKAAELAAAEFGFSLEELVAGPKRGKPKAKAKYRNPDDKEQTWSGRGRKPGWLVDALNSGADLVDLEI